MKRWCVLCAGVALVVLATVPGFGQGTGLRELPRMQPGPRVAPVASARDGLILLKGETIDVRRVSPAANTARIRDGLARLGLTGSQQTYYLVHTGTAADAATLGAITARGGQIVSFVPRNTYIVRANLMQATNIGQVPGVDFVTLYHPVHRISPRLVAKLPTAPDTVTVNLLLFQGESPAAAQAALVGMGGKVLGQANTMYGGFLRARLPKNAVPLLANMAGVQWVEEHLPLKLHNDAATGFGSVTGVPATGIMDIEPVWEPGRDLTGAGMVVGHADTGLDVGVNDPAQIHPDFNNELGTATRITGAFAWGRGYAAADHTFYSGGYTRSGLTQRYDGHRIRTAAGIGARTITRVRVGMVVDPGTRGTITCSIWSNHVTGRPDVQIGSASGTVDLSVIADGSWWDVYFAMPPGITLLENTYYWVVIDRQGASTIANVKPVFTTTGGQRRTSANGTTWSAAYDDYVDYTVYADQDGDWSDTDGHGTHTAGSILGNGSASSGQFRGPAFEASIVHQSVADSGGSLVGIPLEFGPLFQQAYNLGARIHSDSWGSSAAGAYNVDSYIVDNYAWNNKDCLLVFSAGNDGIDDNRDGVVDPGSVGSPGTGKNVLTVGASESVRAAQGLNKTYGGAWPADYPVDPLNGDHVSNNYEGMVAFSSRGPCEDGRIKPDVVAPGTNIISTRSQKPGAGTGWGVYNASYIYNGGTSMACPLTAGAAALVRQYFVDKRGYPTPSSALLKAVMIHGAHDLTGQYVPTEAPQVPNNSEGWGRVDVYASLYAPGGSGYYLDATAANGQQLTVADTSRTASVQIAGTTNPLKVTLVWTDPPSNPAGSGGLINDLELRVYRRNADNTADEVTYLPKLPAGGGTGADHTNNVEQVEIAPGDLIAGRVYRIEVSAPGGINATYGVQPFALTASGDFAGPTPVLVTHWQAKRARGAARLSWRVAEGPDVAGFNVYRAERAAGPFRKLNARLVPVRSNQRTYQYEDRKAPAQDAYYRLEAVTTRGARAPQAVVRCPWRSSVR